jgi:hypothetical protein
LIKTDSEGNLDWATLIGDSHSETGFHVHETHDDGYLVSAISDAFASGPGDFRIWIVRTDSGGDTSWAFPFTHIDGDGFPLYATETFDSGYAVTGRVVASSSVQAFILRLNADGSYGWSNHYGTDHLQDGWFIAQMPDSGFILAGHNDNYYSTGYDYWVLRTDKYGTRLWDSSYALTDYHDAMLAACKVDDGIVMVGTARGAGHALKVDFDGHTVWSKSISKKPYDEKNTAVCRTSDGGLMVGGWVGVVFKNREFCFIKLNADGDTLWSHTTGGAYNDHGRSVVATSDGGFAMAGTSASFVNGESFYLVKIDEVTVDVADPESKGLPSEFRLGGNSPNPFNSSTTISYFVPYRAEVEITIYDLLGREIRVLQNGIKPSGHYTVGWDGRDSDGKPVSSGIYFYRLQADGYSEARKMLFLK